MPPQSTNKNMCSHHLFFCSFHSSPILATSKSWQSCLQIYACCSPFPSPPPWSEAPSDLTRTIAIIFRYMPCFFLIRIYSDITTRAMFWKLYEVISLLDLKPPLTSLCHFAPDQGCWVFLSLECFFITSFSSVSQGLQIGLPWPPCLIKSSAGCLPSHHKVLIYL